MTDTRATQVQMHVDDLLLLMNTSRIKKDTFEYGGREIRLRAFDKAEAFSLVDATHADVEENVDIFTDATLADLNHRVDCTVLGAITEGRFQVGVRRYVTVRRPHLPLPKLTRHVVASQRLMLDRKEQVGYTSIVYYGTHGGGPESWVDLGSGRPLAEAHPGEWRALQIALGIQFNRDYLWYVHLKRPQGEAGVMIPTTPAGAHQLFRLRDVEPGETRRRALIHWVAEHSRRIRKDTADETRTWVKEHVRGEVNFNWGDIAGTIFPAPADLRRLQHG
ncbi:hypothetical protein ACH46I_18690 [Streptomyces griseofuscus]|uniref:hypothetical protein n=2 Tax=Streptomyces griseofuscus TaxID=146922 RepID=UPI0037B5AE25